MKYYSRLFFLNEEGKRVFGKGPETLLTYVQKTGSLRNAAERMGMSYGKAMQIVRRAEEAFGYPLLETQIGGSSGGGSRLTPQAKLFLERYREMDKKLNDYTEQLYAELFSDGQALPEEKE